MTKNKWSEIYEVGDNIQVALDKRGMSQVELSDELNKLAEKRELDRSFSKSHINKWVKNRNTPSIESMDLISTIVEYSVEEIVSGRFGDADRAVDMDDPVIKGEVQQILNYVENACRDNDMDDEQIKRYKSLIKGKINTLIRYIGN